jgi:hypothetical protein
VLYEASALLRKAGEHPAQRRLLFEQLDFAVLHERTLYALTQHKIKPEEKKNRRAQ